VEEGLAIGSTWRPGGVDMRFTLHNRLASKQDGGSIIQGSQSLRSLVEKLHKAGFSESTTLPSQDQGHRTWSQTELNLPKPTVNMIKAAQLRLHKEKVLAIEGDDESEAMDQKRKLASETMVKRHGYVRGTRTSSNLGRHCGRPKFLSSWTRWQTR
jgi:hypothetical protein